MDPDLQMEPGYTVGGPSIIYMDRLISFLREHPAVFSGEEFSDRYYPEELYTHQIELNTNLPELTARPYPAAGIHLDQLKCAIAEQISNGVLIVKDSPTVSPCFFVTKIPTSSSTACKGRLVFDYGRLNKYVKPLHFPLMNQKTFLDQASKFKYFISIDISNAFLSIKLDEAATSFGIF